MSMTKEEAFKQYEEWRNLGFGHSTMPSSEVLVMAMDALRPVSREQVWRGEWKCHGDCGVTECSACGWNIEEYVGNYNFCPVCGAPMTDEAVETIMKRMEEMRND